MKCVVKSLIAMQSAALLLSTGLAGPAAAKNSVPFKGSLQAVEEYSTLLPPDVPFPTMHVDASGSGHATHLGRCAVEYEFDVNMESGFGIGSAEFTGASGDKVTTDIEAQGSAITEDGFAFVVEHHIITGGTGRFAGATGAFTVRRLANVFTGVTSGSFSGSIVLDKGK